MFKKMIGCVIIFALFLCYFTIIPVFAEEVDEITTEEQFYEYLDTHKTIGGKLRLNADIHLTQPYEYTTVPAFRLKQLEIDANGHTIFIESTVRFEYVNHRLFFLSTQDQPIFHVLPSHRLFLSMCDIQSKYAIIQEEGSFLYAPLPSDDPSFYNTMTGNIQYAHLPVIVGKEDPIYQVTSAKEQMYDLPNIQNIRINWEGKLLSYDQGKPYQAAIRWDTDTPLQSNTFTEITGSYHGEILTENPMFQEYQCEQLPVLYPPRAEVISTKDGIAIKDIFASTSDYGTTITATTLSSSIPDHAALMIRFPNEDWQYARDLFDEENLVESPSIAVLFLRKDIPLHFDLAFEFTYFDQILHSNMAVLQDDAITIQEFEGTRGGMAPILPPDDQDPSSPEPTPDSKVEPLPSHPVPDLVPKLDSTPETIQVSQQPQTEHPFLLPAPESKQIIQPSAQLLQEAKEKEVVKDMDSSPTPSIITTPAQPSSKDGIHSYLILILLLVIVAIPVFLLLKKIEGSH